MVWRWILSTSLLFFLEIELKDILIELFLFLCLLFKLFELKVTLGLMKGKLDTKYSSERDWNLIRSKEAFLYKLPHSVKIFWLSKFSPSDKSYLDK